MGPVPKRGASPPSLLRDAKGETGPRLGQGRSGAKDVQNMVISKMCRYIHLVFRIFPKIQMEFWGDFNSAS